ncbi:Nif3-like dinuclear metal center hexameric protein [Moraxella atlantae]|nr:Nif3-like dinuclear metal center hexameric protein [Moraxella atlantae]OPH37090.1 Nif3-like dinuclear metal center hexameric protein [Moraxella atlantae]
MLADFLDDYLQVSAFDDYCPNGLQVDAGVPIARIVTGVTACEALIDAAITEDAQAILVHHGYFWKGEPAPLTGMKGTRVRKLMQHGISLLAYHLPLDAHRVVGNNVQLARALGLTLVEPLYPTQKHPIGDIASLPAPITPAEFTANIASVLARQPLHIASGRATLQRIGICTGGAQDMIEQAAKMGCDAYISGEISERTTHQARELGLDYFACGHHATERGGIQALGEYLCDMLGLAVTFVDIPNPA